VARCADNKGHELLSTGNMRARARYDKYHSFVGEHLKQQCVKLIFHSTKFNAADHQTRG
jgi:hypothetical protein